MTDMNLDMTPEETVGVAAMNELNLSIGHIEKHWVMLRQWRSLTPFERDYLLITHKHFKLNQEAKNVGIVDSSGNVIDSVPNTGGVDGVVEPEGNLEAVEVQPRPDSDPSSGNVDRISG